MVRLQSGEQLFTPNDVSWRVNRELVLMLAGSRALLLEIAHPLVAEGVAQHSDFRRRPLKRLLGTMRAMSQLAFGRMAEAYGAARQVNRCHQQVQGALTCDSGCWQAGTQYDANDPTLRLWVLATLIDSSLVAFDRFVHPLSASEYEGYYRDATVIAPLLGVPKDLFPATYARFRAYCEEMIEGNALHVTDTAREIADALFHGGLISPLIRLGSYAGIGLLPERLRCAYGLRWDAKDEARLNRFAGIYQHCGPFLPGVVCIHPRAWLTELRLRGQSLIGYPTVE